GIDHGRRGDDGGAVLVVVEYRNIALLNQRTLDLEALRRLDIFQVDTAKGAGNTLDGIDEGLRAFRLDLDIEDIDTGKALEQHTLAFHDRLGGYGPQIAQTQNCGAIGNHRHQVALAGVFEGIVRILGDFTHRLCNTRTVSQRQITRSGSRLGQLDAQLTRTRVGMVFERISSQIRHDYFFRSSGLLRTIENTEKPHPSQDDSCHLASRPVAAIQG